MVSFQGYFDLPLFTYVDQPLDFTHLVLSEGL